MRALALAEAIKGVYVGVALGVASASYASMASTTENAAFKEATTTASAITGEAAVYSFAYTGKALADFNRRYKATTATENYLVVLSEVAPRDFKLLQVDKRTGKTISSLDLGKDRDPVYELDFVDHYLYHQSGNSEITCFKLQGN